MGYEGAGWVAASLREKASDFRSTAREMRTRRTTSSWNDAVEDGATILEIMAETLDEAAQRMISLALAENGEKP